MNDLQQPIEEIGNTERRTPNSWRSAAEHRSTADLLAWVKHFFDYLSASREEPPPGASFMASPIWTGIWWGVLIGLILLFCGQTSKFIYIDF